MSLKISTETIRNDYVPIDVIAKQQTLTRRVILEYIDSVDVVEYPIYFRKVDQNERDEESEEALQESLSRARNSIVSLARANKWEWFITLTFDPKEFPSFDFDAVGEYFSKFWNKLKRKFPDIKYLAVPELHHDRFKYHFHMLLSGLPSRYFMLSATEKLPNNHNLLLWDYFTTCVPVADKSSDKIGFYIAKYFTKEFDFHFNKKRYFRTYNLDDPKCLYVGWVSETSIESNSYVIKNQEGRIVYVRTRYEK